MAKNCKFLQFLKEFVFFKNCNIFFPKPTLKDVKATGEHPALQAYIVFDFFFFCGSLCPPGCIRIRTRFTMLVRTRIQPKKIKTRVPRDPDPEHWFLLIKVLWKNKADNNGFCTREVMIQSSGSSGLLNINTFRKLEARLFFIENVKF